MDYKTVEFIKKAREVHGEKYDYSKVIYENNLKEVAIICDKHGEFLQLPKTHKRGNGCILCGRCKTIEGKKSNTNEFISKAKDIHKDKYDYSKVCYDKANEKVIIICQFHNEFLQTPNSHLDGKGCKKCSIEYITGLQKSNTNEFIIKAKNIHGDKYDYSKVNYINNNIKVTIICKEHNEFEQPPSSHLSGGGCRLCGINSRAFLKTKTTEEFIDEANKIHGYKFDYSETIYTKCDENIIIICNEHGKFEQNPQGHLSGRGCRLCGINSTAYLNTKTTEEFINEANIIHKDKYDYSKVIYKKAIEKITIVCKIHGDFEITPNSHLNGSGCSICGILSTIQKQTYTKNDFIVKAIMVHNNKYDYSNVKYIDLYSKITIFCKEHDNFEQTPQGHLSGRGCIKCANKYSYTTDEWICKAKKIHGEKYDYSKSIYTSCKNNISIICNQHGLFEQLPVVHLRPAGCSKCNPRQFSKKQIEWLNFIQIFYGINIQHALNGEEYRIQPTKFKADGYCEKTNTIYEFHGDLWHGNPKIYNQNEISRINKNKKYGELYQNTLFREHIIKDLGYNLVVMWEYDWNKINK
jgi:hypothetical protein